MYCYLHFAFGGVMKGGQKYSPEVSWMDFVRVRNRSIMVGALSPKTSLALSHLWLQLRCLFIKWKTSESLVQISIHSSECLSQPNSSPLTPLSLQNGCISRTFKNIFPYFEFQLEASSMNMKDNEANKFTCKSQNDLISLVLVKVTLVPFFFFALHLHSLHFLCRHWWKNQIQLLQCVLELKQ